MFLKEEKIRFSRSSEIALEVRIYEKPTERGLG